MPKRPPLVCQHLENIARKALEQHQEIIRDYVRNRHGVYALYRRGRLYYVGLASNLRIRLGHHLKDRHADSWDRFSIYLTVGDEHLRELESLLLRIVKTPGNKQKGKFPKSEDLCRRFRRDMKKDWDQQMQEMFGIPVNQPDPAKIHATKHQPEGRRPILADHITGPMTLRARHKGKTIRAFVRKTGVIFFDGKHFTSPSLAGAHAVKRPTCNGWTFWHYERAPGDWVPLDTLRK